MEKSDLVLAALASVPGADYSPVQLQKLFFLLDKNIHGYINGPVFSFRPYDYGPFDEAVYTTLENLELSNRVQKLDVPGYNWKKYKLTEAGQNAGLELLNTFPDSIQQYIREVSNFVRSLTFSQLVSSIYHAYPEMKVNSVFNK